MIHVVLEVSIGPELDVCRNYMASRSGTALVPDLAATEVLTERSHVRTCERSHERSHVRTYERSHERTSRPPLIPFQGGSGGEPPRENEKVPTSFKQHWVLWAYSSNLIIFFTTHASLSVFSLLSHHLPPGAETTISRINNQLIHH